MKARKKRIVVDYFRYGIDPIPDWFQDKVTAGDIITYEHCCEIKTLEGVMRGDFEDRIIRGVEGEIYPCKPDIFQKTYEDVIERNDGERAYPFPNGEYKPYITITDESVTFVGQSGPIKEVGVNGCQIDDIIEFAMDVLIVFNQRLPCRETSMMITKLDEALLWGMKRRLDREKRDVEGTSNP